MKTNKIKFDWLNTELLVDWFKFPLGEKLTAENVDTLVQGMEDSNGMINYEGM